MVMGAFGGGLMGGMVGGVIGQAVVEIVADNRGLEGQLTKQQKALAGLAVAGFGAAVVAATSYETAMAGVQKTTNASAEQMAALNAQFREQSREIPLTAHQLAGLGATAAQLGVETENLGEFVDTVSKLGTATNIVGEQGAQDLARFINVAGETTQTAENIASSIVDLGNNSATTEAEILDMALRTAAAGRQFGLTTGDTLGLAAAMSSLGIRSEAGGTALSRVILDIFSASEKGGDALREYADIAGMTVDEYEALTQSSPIDALMAFINGLGTAEARGLNVVAMLDSVGAGGVRVRDTLLRLAGAQDLMTESVDRGNEAYESGTALQKEFEVFSETLANQLKILRNQALDLAIGVGETAVPAISALVSALSAGVDVFNQVPAPLRNILLVLTAMVTLGPALNAMLLRSAAGIRGVGVAAAASNGSLMMMMRSMGPAGFLGVLAAVGIGVDAILTKTTGHGLIDWLFRDPRTADAAAASVARVNDELERMRSEGEELNPIAAAMPEIERQVAKWEEGADRLARASEEARDAFDLTTILEETQRSMKEADQAIVDNIKNLDEQGVAFSDLIDLVLKLPPAVRENITAQEWFQNKLEGALPQIRRTSDEMGNLRREKWEEAQASRANAEATEELTGSQYRLADALGITSEELADLTPRALAAQAAIRMLDQQSQVAYGRAGGRMVAPGSIQGVRDFINETIAGLQAHDADFRTLEGLTDYFMREAGLLDDDSASSDRSARSGGSVSSPITSAINGILEDFEGLAARAPRAMEPVIDELQLYEDAAREAGDAATVALIERLRELDPTSQEVRTAITALSDVYGDLAEEARIAAEETKRAEEEALRERAANIDLFGGMVVTTLRRQYDAQLDNLMDALDDQREALRDGLDDQLLDLERQRDRELAIARSRADALTAPLRAQLDELAQADLNAQFRDIDEEIAQAWDPRERQALLDRRAALEQRVEQDRIRNQIRDIEDGLRDEEQEIADSHQRRTEDARSALDRQLADLDEHAEETRERYADLTQDWKLQSEAREMILSGELDRMIQLIEDKVPEFRSLGLSLSDAVMGGLRGSVPGEVRGALGAIGSAPAGIHDPGSLWGALMAQGAARMANGALVDSPTLALIGEAARTRPEIVSPEGLMRRVVREESGGGSINARIFIGDREITDIVRVEIDERERRAGSFGALEDGIKLR